MLTKGEVGKMFHPKVTPAQVNYGPLLLISNEVIPSWTVIMMMEQEWYWTLSSD